MNLSTHTIELCLATILALPVLGCVRALLRLIRLRHLQRLLGWAYWPLLHALDQRDSRQQESRRDG
jgi:hypothetical protein